MKPTEWVALCHLGAEQALQNELAQHNISSEQLIGGCRFSCDAEIIGKALYHLQVPTRLLAQTYVGAFESFTPDATHALITQEQTFKVEVELLDGSPEHLTSQVAAATIGEHIDRDVNLNAPDVTVFCQIATQTVCGIDIAGDLSKRYYRVFTNPGSIKGTLAAAGLWHKPLSGTILDPFGNTGEPAIEAAIKQARVSPLFFKKHQPLTLIDEQREQWKDDAQEAHIYCYDPQLANTRSAQKNAKLAGVDKVMKFSKLEVEWLDTKFEDGQVDAIITHPPRVTKRQPETAHLKELCYQAAFVLKKGGIMCVMCGTDATGTALLKYASTYKLSLVDECVVFSGKHPVHIMYFER